MYLYCNEKFLFCHSFFFGNVKEPLKWNLDRGEVRKERKWLSVVFISFAFDFRTMLTERSNILVKF